MNAVTCVLFYLGEEKVRKSLIFYILFFIYASMQWKALYFLECINSSTEVNTLFKRRKVDDDW